MERIRKHSISVLVGVVLITAAIGLYGAFTSTAKNQPQAKALQPVKVGFIGDSITDGKGASQNAVQVEMSLLGGNYEGVNRGVGGTTTTDWLPGKPAYQKAVAAFRSQGVTIVSLMLGTNDASKMHRISPRIYHENLASIIAGLRSEGFIRSIILNYPPYAVPGASKYRWDDKSIHRLEDYTSKIDLLVDDNFVLLGDTKAFTHFAEHPGELRDGIHPNNTGYSRLGALWADAFKLATRRLHDMPDFVASTGRHDANHIVSNR